MRPRDRKERIGAPVASEQLQIAAADYCTHTKSYQHETRALGQNIADIVLKLTSEELKTCATVRRLQ